MAAKLSALAGRIGPPLGLAVAAALLATMLGTVLAAAYGTSSSAAVAPKEEKGVSELRW